MLLGGVLELHAHLRETGTVVSLPWSDSAPEIQAGAQLGQDSGSFWFLNSLVGLGFFVFFLNEFSPNVLILLCPPENPPPAPPFLYPPQL